MKPLAEKDVIDMNKNLIATFSPKECFGVKYPKLLDSALNRPFQTMFGKYLYPDIFDKAVALFESLAKNHPFHNGNKRTAFGAMTYFLYVNDHICYMNNEDAANLTVDFVTGKLDFVSVVQIVKGKTYRKSSWKTWLSHDENEMLQEINQSKNKMMVCEEPEDDYDAGQMNEKTKEEVQAEVFANAIPFDEEAFAFIVDMYYDTFKALVNR